MALHGPAYVCTLRHITPSSALMRKRVSRSWKGQPCPTCTAKEAQARTLSVAFDG